MKEIITMTKQPDGSYAFEIPESKEDKALELHNMAGALKAGWIDKIPDWKLAGIPIGEAAKAMITAGIGDAAGLLVIRVMPGNVFSGRYAIALLKALTIAGLNWKPVKGFLGEDAVKMGSIILAYEGIASIFNVRTQVSNVLSKVTNVVKTTTTTTTAQAADNIETL